MKIHNIRLGFATNSSSSHSLIFDPNIKVADKYEGDNFGWNFFTCSSKKAKQKYLGSMFRQNFQGFLPEPIIKGLLKSIELEADEPYRYESGIDHQSLYNIPFEFGYNIPSLEFFNDMKDFILKEGIHILGGNDNDDQSHPLFSYDKKVSFEYKPDEDRMVCRKDGDWWTLFNKISGNRIVFSFLDNPSPFNPETPHLVDFKCTDYCDIGCAFCYQGSTVNGNHLKNSVYSYVKPLSDAKVFEVAIGGGEPTKFKDFPLLVQSLHEKGITANFTTKSVDWLENEKTANTIIPYIGAFAYSVDDKTSFDTLDRILSIFKYRNYKGVKFTIQLIPAIFYGDYKIKEILKWAKKNFVRVTLLGFKESGRGFAFKQNWVKKIPNEFSETHWISIVNDLSGNNECPTISIDTTLASRYEKELEALNIPKYLYHIEEGKYSMYIDGVQNKFGPSSYHVDSLEEIGNVWVMDIKEMFSSIEAVKG